MSSTGPAAPRPAAEVPGSESPTPGTGPAETAASGRRAPETTVPSHASETTVPDTRSSASRAPDTSNREVTTSTTSRVPWSTVALTAAVAVAGTLALYLLAGATGTDLRAPMGQGGEIQDVPALSVPIAAVVGVFAAAVALRVVQRLLPRHAWPVWLGLVGLGFLLSLAPMPTVPAESVPWLVAMHALVAVAAVALIGRRARSR